MRYSDPICATRNKLKDLEGIILYHSPTVVATHSFDPTDLLKTLRQALLLYLFHCVSLPQEISSEAPACHAQHRKQLLCQAAFYLLDPLLCASRSQPGDGIETGTF